MYHKLVNELTRYDDLHSYKALLNKLDNAGFIVEEENRNALTDEDLNDVWTYLAEKGPSYAVDYLETMFGFLFRGA